MPDKNSLLIYTIIVTYNGEQWIRKCLSALAASSVESHVIVVDNASTDNTINIIRNEFPQTEFLKNTDNKGFGAANNIAIKIAVGRNADYVFLLNQDVYIEKDTLKKMVELFCQHNNYGIISPVQLNGNGINIEESFKMYLQRVLSAGDVTAIEQRKKQDVELIPVRFANAAAWLIPIAVIKKTGLFHPLFFHYGEDNNYSSRVQYHGYTVGVALNTHVLHDRIADTNKQKELLRKIKTIIRYTATDPRKRFTSAYIQAWYKYFLLKKKAHNNAAFFNDALKIEKEFLMNRKALTISRREMKQTAVW